MVDTLQLVKTVVADGNSATMDTGTLTGDLDVLRVVVEIEGGGSGGCRMRFNSNTGSNYRRLFSENGGSKDGHGDGASNAISNMVGRTGRRSYSINTIYNISGKETSGYGHCITDGGNTGSANAPTRMEYAFKWANTAQITSIQIISDSTSWASGSTLNVYAYSRADEEISDEKDDITNVPVNTRYEETDTRKIYRFATTSSSHSGGTSGSDDVSGIGADSANPRGGWGQQIKTGHPLVGKKLKTLTVTTRLSSNIAGRSDKDMTVKVFAGTDTTTIRGTSQAISTSTLTTAGTWYDKTFTFTNAVELSADDCICVCIDGDVGTGGGWNAKIKGSPEDTNKGYWVAFQDATNPASGSIQTNRSMIYTATYEQNEWKERNTA